MVSETRPTAVEAADLWRAWVDERDVRARDRLVLSYAPMVKYLACRKVRELPAHCDIEDLVSSGLVALLRAVDLYDPTKGSFESYAWTRVSGAMIDELRAQDWAPRSVRRSGREIERARGRCLARTGRPPTDSELADELNIQLEELRTKLARLDRAEIGSLNTLAWDNEVSAIEVIDTLEAPAGVDDPETIALANERSRAVRKAISRLPERQQQIVTMLYYWEMPGAEVARVLGVSESRVSQIMGSIRATLSQRIDADDPTDQRDAA
jgi:RNA polymerase sigma factor for flagellar operon FliA